MSGNLKDRGPQDRSRISLNEEWEMRYWTKALGVTEDRLRRRGESGRAPTAVRVEPALRERRRAINRQWVPATKQTSSRCSQTTRPLEQKGVRNAVLDETSRK